MNILIIVDEPAEWPLDIPGVSVVAARTYLIDPFYANGISRLPDQTTSRSVKVFNLCKSYRYQSSGYYVSLLAEARGHKPLPKVGTIEDLQSQNLVRYLTEDLNAMIQRLLAPLAADDFVLGIYFGRSISSHYDSLSHQLFNLLQAPLLSARFERHRDQWSVRNVRAIAASDIPTEHHEFAVRAAMDYFTGRSQAPRKHPFRFDLAILHDPSNPEPPSNAKALEKFKRAAEELSMRVEFITRNDIGRIPQFDALFIRDTTFVNHYTYRFSRRALAERLVVIDDPDSILKCNNKVYLAELLSLRNIPIPKTLLVHRDNIARIIPELALPCVLKQPDSSFSRGVVKVEAEAELPAKVTELMSKSVLIIAQEWLFTDFDWRVGILDRRILFVARYRFPAGHWQVIKRDDQQRKLSEGPTEAIAVGDAPQEMVEIALKSANLIGDGFYGVDIKQVGNRFYVIEINDNPNVDAGNEDGVLKDALYREVMGVFLKRIEARKQGHPQPNR
ncbi:RimK family protein [Nitrosovibrio tenuis]|nr:RimK family protein [Nitrosovibrio tenuis]